MPKLFHLHIENFRGIKRFDHTFKDGLTCIIGRGDSGKSTILEAISSVLSASYSLQFNDGDFYNCDVSKPIVIQVVITELNEEILRKLGNHIIGIKDGEIIESMLDEKAIDAEEAVRIELRVKKDLEPEWALLGVSGTEPRPIRASERELFNCFYISDYNDRHFTLSKGTPLSSLFKQKSERKLDVLNAELIANLGRTVKIGFNTAIQEQEVFNEVFEAISKNATSLGLNAGEVKASIDQREFLLKENKIALHRNDIPLRQLGKGSKRILSLAIQLSLTSPSGIILIDEIEQGLEPDRVQQIVAYLGACRGIQVIFTTHSQHAVEELECDNLFIKTSDSETLQPISTALQGLVRKHPLALFAKSIIIGEGATEYGFIRGMNEIRQQQGGKSMSFYGVCPINGNGDECVATAMHLVDLGFRVCLLCDSDVDKINAQKDNLRTNGVSIYDCADGMAFESQLFNDCHWETVKALINYRISCNQNSKGVFENIRHHLIEQRDYCDDWYVNESDNLRIALSKASGNKNNPWFKSIGMGHDVALIVLGDMNKLDHGTQLYKNISSLYSWIEMA